MQNDFPNMPSRCPVEIYVLYGPMCFILQTQKNCFFLEARSNSKTTLKTKGIVIYRGNNNGGNNVYYEQRIR